MLLPNNFIAENILNILKAKKISVKDLAADLKEPEYRILNWLNRKEEIPAYFIPYISEALQVSNDKILNKHKSYTGIEEHYIDYENPYDLLNHFIIDGLDDIFIYRGQNNDWLLQPSYCRFCNRNRILLDKLVLNCDACPLEDLFKEKILNRIKKECSVYDLSNKIKDFNNEALLAYMQHHNIPTPLLDWTISPLIALYFAIKDSYERDCITLYAFNLSEYDKTHPRYTDFNEIKPG
ncbi:MAG: FRG domain-containing protein, partial [Candidatus Riflebacteria bacterium]|nr:FRG domain-containing protein [Candidatus Riflebacteria bacterium]